MIYNYMDIEEDAMIRRLGQSYQVALPKEVVKHLHLKVNDLLDIHTEAGKIILEPQIVIPKDQAYFYTPEWQKDEKSASEDIRKGRVTKTKSLKELHEKLDE